MKKIEKALWVAKRTARKADGGGVSDPNDMTDQYNTKLSPQDEAKFQSWAAANPRLGDTYDYDSRGFWQAGAGEAANGHGGDQWKKPNHTTFSTQSQYSTPEQSGGVWAQRPDGSYSFSPSSTNLKTNDIGDLQNYFEKEEPGNQLIMPAQPQANGGAVRKALRIARKANGGGVFSGYIHGTTGGRTDNKPIDVESGSYVIPADILSGLGEGNSHAGWAALQKQFGMDAPPMKADGGPVGQPTPIVAASGEAVVPADKVAEIGGGDLDRGHSILDAMVKHVRKKTIKKLKSLPGPKKS